MADDLKRLLVTGANGFVGRAVVAHLSARGGPVRAGVRQARGGWPAGVEEAVMGDLSPAMDAGQALAGVDTVVHCAARAHVLKETSEDPAALFRQINTEATLALARQAVQAGVRRFIFISSIGVNGAETKGRAFRHDDAPAPHSPYAQSKHAAELGLRALAADTGLEVVIIRPPLILGAEPKGNLATLNKVIARGLPLPFALVSKNRRDLVSLETLCSLIDTVADHPAAAGQTFLVSDGAPLSTRALLERMAADQGRSATLIPLPPSGFSWLLNMAGKGGLASQLLGDLEVDIDHTRRTLGWSPPLRHDQASSRRQS